MIRRRARMGGESRPRPDGGFERVMLDSSSDEIIIDGVPIGAANDDADRGSGNPLKFLLWIVTILVLAMAASGYWNALPGKIQNFWDDLQRPSFSLPGLSDTGPLDPQSDSAAPVDSRPTDPLSKKNTY